ncbi:MAG: hypothetical protein ACFFE8_07325 [Candidatus Heimdallarchaeota archaeon]
MTLGLTSSLGFFTRFLVIFVLCLNPIVSLGAIPNKPNDLNQSMPFQIVQDEISYMGGVKSIQAVIGTSRIGILHRTSENPQPIRFFAEYTQRIAKIERLNTRGTVVEELELNTTNSILFQLDNLVEFEDNNGNSWYDPRGTDRLIRSVNISNIVFSVQKLSEKINSTALQYQIIFSALDVSYGRRFRNSTTTSSKLEKIAFSFELTITREMIEQVQVPTIRIRPQGRSLDVTVKPTTLPLRAIRLTPRLKFSMNITGWDFNSPTSKLALKITTFAREQFQITRPLIQLNLSRNILQATNLLGRLKFVAQERDKSINQSYELEHDKSQGIEFARHRLVNSRFSFGNRDRDFLNFTWIPTVLADSIDFPVYFQSLSSGEQNRLVNPSPPYNLVSMLYLTGIFVFPQGNQIFYDPEVLIEVINPVELQILPIPNRSFLLPTSLLILVSGFLLGIVVIIRKFTERP